MWQITEHAPSGRRALSPSDLESTFLATCEAHRAQGRALAFAFILFDARHPHLRKALEDPAYWEALDDLSGRQLTVYTFLAYMHDRRPGAAPHGTRAMFGIPRLMTAPPHELLAEYFPGVRRQKLPCVLFFQVDSGEVIGSTAVSLTVDNNPAAAYNEVADLLQTALVSIARVEDDSAANSAEIFHLIESALAQRALKDRAIALYQGARKLPVAAVMRLIHGLL